MIRRLLFGFQLLVPGLEDDRKKLRSTELQRERYPRGAGSNDAQITFQLCVGRNRPSIVYHSDQPDAYRIVHITRP